MRVTFINRFYWPAETATAQLLTDLAEALAARGWHVQVVTGHSSAGLANFEIHQGVEIHRVGRRMSSAQDLVRRAFDFVFFHLGAWPALRRHGRRGDVFVALTDPPLIGLTVNLAAASRGAHLIHWVQDIYPEVVRAVSTGFIPRIVSSLLRKPRDMAWRSAAACVTLGDDMRAYLQSRGTISERTHIVPNWAPRGITPPPASAVQSLREQWQVTDRFVVSYSGNFGRVHDLSHILDVAYRLRDDVRFVFLFIGNGAAFAALQRGVEDRALSNVRFLPARPRSELSVSLGAGDVQLISLRRGCEHLVFPSKLYGIAAAARPVLLLGSPESEIGRIVRDQGLGMVFRPDDVDGITSGLRSLADASDQQRLFSTGAARFDAANGGCERAVGAWEEILRRSAGLPAANLANRLEPAAQPTP